MPGTLRLNTESAEILHVQLTAISYVPNEQLMFVPSRKEYHDIVLTSNRVVDLADIHPDCRDRATLFFLKNVWSERIIQRDVIVTPVDPSRPLLGFIPGALRPYHCLYPQLQPRQPCSVVWDGRDALEITLRTKNYLQNTTTEALGFEATSVLLNDQPLKPEYCQQLIQTYNMLQKNLTEPKIPSGDCRDFPVPSRVCSETDGLQSQAYLLEKTEVLQPLMTKVLECAATRPFVELPDCLEQLRKWQICSRCLQEQPDDASQCFPTCKNQPKLFACHQGLCKPSADGVRDVECLRKCGNQCVQAEQPRFSCQPDSSACGCDPNGRFTDLYTCQKNCLDGKLQGSQSWLWLIVTGGIFLLTAIIFGIVLYRSRKRGL